MKPTLCPEVLNEKLSSNNQLTKSSNESQSGMDQSTYNATILLRDSNIMSSTVTATRIEDHEKVV